MRAAIYARVSTKDGRQDTENQLRQLMKESIELAHVINDYLDGKDTLDHVKEEMGDCDNLISQFEEHWNDGAIHCIVKEKRERQLQRIREEKK